MPKVEVWLRGPVPDVPPGLMPVAHSLIGAREELEALVPPLSPDRLWERTGGAASVGFHLTHLCGSTDRLFTYARGEPLSPAQRAALESERRGGDESSSGAEAFETFRVAVDGFLEQLRGIEDGVLDDFRGVGAQALPSTVRGLLFHAAEHAQRHVGQIATTLIVQGRS